MTDTSNRMDLVREMRARAGGVDRLSPRYALAGCIFELCEALEKAENELSIWRSVFPDVAPERVMPDRSKLEASRRRLARVAKAIKSIRPEWRTELEDALAALQPGDLDDG